MSNQSRSLYLSAGMAALSLTRRHAACLSVTSLHVLSDTCVQVYVCELRGDSLIKALNEGLIRGI